MNKALQHLQGYLHTSYWYPILIRLLKRNEQISVIKDQMVQYRLSNVAPNVDNILKEHNQDGTDKQEKLSRQELRTVLNKFCKNNIKLSIPLDMNLLVDVIKMFVDCSLNQIKVKFTNLKSLTDQYKSF
tara:strand:- start:160 stop:546 length:387 start_codon:yes stop_codon:yes gene_type:complete